MASSGKIFKTILNMLFARKKCTYEQIQKSKVKFVASFLCQSTWLSAPPPNLVRCLTHTQWNDSHPLHQHHITSSTCERIIWIRFKKRMFLPFLGDFLPNSWLWSASHCVQRQYCQFSPIHCFLRLPRKNGIFFTTNFLRPIFSNPLLS